LQKKLKQITVFVCVPSGLYGLGEKAAIRHPALILTHTYIRQCCDCTIIMGKLISQYAGLNSQAV